MKNTRKTNRILGCILAFSLLLTLLPTGVFAATSDTVSVAGVTLTADTPYLATGSTTAVAEKPDASAGYAYWDLSALTLTLHNYRYSGNGFDNGWHCAVYRAGDTTLMLEGENALTIIADAQRDSSSLAAIRTHGGNLTIDGSGTLAIEITAEPDVEPYFLFGISVYYDFVMNGGTLTIDCNGVEATNGPAGISTAAGSATINSGKLSVTNGIHGLDTNADSLIINGGELTLDGSIRAVEVYNDTVSRTVAPAEGVRIAISSGDSSSQTDESTYTASADISAHTNKKYFHSVTDYLVTVTNGSASGGDSGYFTEGESVTVTADAAPDGQQFKEWTGADGLTFTGGSATTSAATFTMPNRTVSLTAAYEDIPAATYAVTVNNGTGGGSFAEGATVTVTADAAPVGQQFKEWTGVEGLTFTNGSATTSPATFTMPAEAVTVTATYETAPLVLTGIAVKTPPARTVYAAGEALDLSGLAVTLTYSNGVDTTTSDVAFADFASNGINVFPANGTRLHTTDTAVTVSKDGKSATVSLAYKPIEIRIGGKGLASGQYVDDSGNVVSSDSEPASGSYAYYKDGTLTLNNYTYTGVGYEYDHFMSATVYREGDLALVLKGSSRLANTATDDGIRVSSGKLTVSGTGALEVAAGSDGLNAGDDLTITGGTLVITSDRYGVYTSGILSIDGTSAVLSIGTNDTAVRANNGVSISDGLAILIPDNGVIRPAGDSYATILDGGRTADIAYIAPAATAHTHSWSAAYTYDEKHHWKTCTADGCPTAANPVLLTGIADSGYASHALTRGDCAVCEYIGPAVWVGGVGLMNDQYLANGADAATAAAPATGGYAHYADGILTLNNYAYSGVGYEYDGYGSSVIYSEDALAIVLVGQNDIENTSDWCDGISATALTLSGDGSLAIAASYGIYVWDGDVAINSGTVEIAAISGILVDEGSVSFNGGTVNIDASNGEAAVTARRGIFFANDAGVLTSDDASIVIDEYGYRTLADASGNYNIAVEIGPGGTAPENPVVPEIYVGGVGMADGTYLASGADATTTTAPASGGYAHYSRGILTLNNYAYSGTGYEYDTDYTAVIYAKDDLAIVLVGQNAITNTSADGDGITLDVGRLTLSGGGSLAVVADYGVYVWYGDFAINGGTVEITAISGIIINSGTVSFNGGTTTIEEAEVAVSAEDSITLTNVEILEPADGEVVYADDYYVIADASGNTGIKVVIGAAVEEDSPVVSGGGSSVYNVYYHSNNAAAEKVSGGRYAYNANVKVKDASALTSGGDKVFLGWAERADGAAVYQAGDTFKMPRRAVNLYAVWGDGEEPVPPAPSLNKESHDAYIQGYPDGSVKPSANITREEAATLFFRLLNNETRNAYLTDAHPFTDVAAERWSNTAIATLANAGIITGRTETAFAPGEPITRAEFAAMAARFDSEAYTGDDLFTDIAGHWAASLINSAAARGWVTGDGDGSFRPDDFITRAEAATLINRVLDRIPGSAADLPETMTTFTDNTDTNAWYYIAIQEAANSHHYTRNADGTETWTAP